MKYFITLLLLCLLAFAGFESVRRKRGQWMLMGGGGKFFDTGVRMKSGSASFVIESVVVQ